MKFLMIFAYLIATCYAMPQFFGSPYGGGFGFPSFGGGFGGSSSHAAASSQSFNGGFSPFFGGGFSGSSASANAGSSSFGFGK